MELIIIIVIAIILALIGIKGFKAHWEGSSHGSWYETKSSMFVKLFCVAFIVLQILWAIILKIFKLNL